MALVHGLADRTLHTVATVDRVFWLNADGTEVVEGGIPVAADDGTLTWPNGGEPSPGATYSMSGTNQAEYFCYMDLPRNRNAFHGLKLPRTVLLRNFDLYGR